MAESYADPQCSKYINAIDPWKDPEKTTLVNTYFWLDGVARCVISCIGIIGNIITVVLFSSKDLRSTFHMFLVALACVDLGYLFLTLLEEIPQMKDIQKQGTTYPDPESELNRVWVLLYPHFIRPIQYVFITAAEYITIIICVDRYIAIKHPLRHYSPHWNVSSFDNNFFDQRNHGIDIKKNRTNGLMNMDWRRVMSYSLSVMLISILYCLPVFFEYESVPATENRSATINETELSNSESYIIGYYVVLDAMIRFFLPVCISIFTNFTIHKIVSKQPVKFNDQAAYQKRVQNVMLFGVVIVLIVVHSYRLGLNVYQLVILKSLELCGKDYGNQISHIVSRVLLTLNCSVNCFVYLAASKKFRNVAYKYYTTTMIWLFPVFSSTGNLDNSRQHMDTANERIPQTAPRQRKLTPITPFGSGYVSWGTRGASSDNVHVVVSKKTTKREEVMQVSVITSELKF